MSAAESPWVDGLTVGQVLEKTATSLPSLDALVFPHRNLRWTWKEFDRQVDETARALVAWGIQPGEHVAVWATNVPEWVFLQFATARIGAVLVTVNPAYKPFELQYVLKQSDCVALFLVDSFKSADYFEILQEVCPEASQIIADEPIQSAEFPKLRHTFAINGSPPTGCHSWSQFIARAVEVSQKQVKSLAEQTRPGDKINIQYTSGTTGFPKAAMLSHRNLLLNAYYVGECQGIQSHDRICIPVPFYHCFGCVLGTLCASVYGAAMIIPADYFRAQATLEAIDREKATVIYGVPTMFIAQLEDPSFANWNLQSLRTGIMAGSPCPIEVMKKVIQDMGAEQMTIAYGQTEASPVVTQTRTDDPVQLRVETVGRSIPGVEIKIIDPATGETLPDNQQGELCSRGHVVMLGYYNNEEATKDAIDEDGWLHSGDLAIRLENGYFRITGRIKDMVIRGGENIYPREIEEFLFSNEKIEQAAVVGLPDAKYGEELCVWVKIREGASMSETELQQFCRDNLARFKVPRYVRFVNEFPQTVTGKIQKFKIREQMCDELGLEEEETA